MKLLELLKYVKKRPSMYLAKKDLYQLDAFIGGYLICQEQNEIKDESAQIFPKTFYDFVFEKYNRQKVGSWMEAVNEIAEREGVDAFDLFFDLLDEIKDEKNLR